MRKYGPPRKKQIIYQSKGTDDSYLKMYSLLNLSHYVKSCGHFCQILAFFYDVRSPNVVISRDPRSKFRNFFLFCLNSTFNIRKSYKISSGKRSLLQKLSAKNLTERRVENTFVDKTKEIENDC